MSGAPPALATEERAALVALLVAGGEAAAPALARLPARVAAAGAQVLAWPQAERAAWLAATALELAAPAPAHLELVHPSWVNEALAGEDDAIRAAAVRAPEAEPSALAWLRRVAFGELVAMPARMAEPAALAGAVEGLGLLRLALALVAAPPAAQAAVALRLGPGHGAALMTELRRAAGERAAAGVAVRELGELVAGSATLLLLSAGARHLGPALAERGDLARQIAQRLPRPLGVCFLAEAARPSPATPLAASAAALDALHDLLH